jgi:hypothetical protein
MKYKPLFIILLVILISFLNTVYGYFREANYVTSQSQYINPIPVSTQVLVPLNSISVAAGEQVRLRILIPAGLNLVQFNPSSNSFQYGARLGNSESTLGVSNGDTMLLYFDLEENSTENYAYIYIDNSNGSRTFTLSGNSSLLIYTQDTTEEYDAWCNTMCNDFEHLGQGGNTSWNTGEPEGNNNPYDPYSSSGSGGTSSGSGGTTDENPYEPDSSSGSSGTTGENPYEPDSSSGSSSSGSNNNDPEESEESEESDNTPIDPLGGYIPGNLPTFAPPEELEGDEKLACEAVLCLASLSPPHECDPALEYYFSIERRVWDDTVEARTDFLELCPDEEEQIPGAFLETLVNGAGRCDIETLRDLLNPMYDVENGWINSIYRAIPQYCIDYHAHSWTRVGQDEDGEGDLEVPVRENPEGYCYDIYQPTGELGDRGCIESFSGNWCRELIHRPGLFFENNRDQICVDMWR